MRTIVYIDAFNLYYGCLKGTPYRWLNLEQLSRLLLSANNTITRIKYFTARVSARPGDLDQPNRHQLYLRALGTLPKVEVHYGHYLTHEVMMPVASPPPWITPLCQGDQDRGEGFRRESGDASCR